MATSDYSTEASDTYATDATEEVSAYDCNRLLTCCCGGSSHGKSSIDELEVDTNQRQPYQESRRHMRRPRQKRKRDQRKKESKSFNKTPSKIWGRLSDVALAIVGLAPPVKFIQCLGCASVDGSELTQPRVLSDLAYEYDRKKEKMRMANENKKTNSIWNVWHKADENDPKSSTWSHGGDTTDTTVTTDTTDATEVPHTRPYRKVHRLDLDTRQRRRSRSRTGEMRRDKKVTWKNSSDSRNKFAEEYIYARGMKFR